MRGRARITRQAAPIDGAVERFATVDREVARALSAQLGERHRLSFARSFTFAVLQACRDAAAQPVALAKPEGVDLLPLSAEAERAARQFGATLASLPVRQAMHLAGVIYTTALPEGFRATQGIFYTPPALVDRLLAMSEEAGVDWNAARILDPACGGGAFLVPLALRMAATLKRSNPAFILRHVCARLRGFELDPFGAWLAQTAVESALRDVICAARKPMPSIVEVRDSLDINPADVGRFNLVVGNPPYGRVTPSPQRRSFFKRSVYGHANLYGLFTDAALHWVADGGVVGYVTPTSMLSGLYYKALRGLLAAEAAPLAVNFVTERTGIFADVLQETILATYQRGATKRASKVGFITLDAEETMTFRKGGVFALPSQPDVPWLLPRTPQQIGLTRRLRSMPHRLRDYGYSVSTGPLVWNRFKGQFRDHRSAKSYPVIWAESVTSDGRFLWRSEKRNHVAWFDGNLPKDAWLIVTEPCVLLQRTTAKEQARRLIAAEMPESFVRRHKGVIVENHLNMVRAVTPSPIVPSAVIAALLRSAPVDAAFRCINGSVAVSAFELEELPLPPPVVMTRLATLVDSGAPVREIDAVIAAAYAREDATAAF